ncbi:MAG: hypothetical protein WCQ47_08730, partial [bacterium]
MDGQVQVISSMVKRHPNFIRQNVRFKSNPLDVLKPVNEIVNKLGDNANSLTFGLVSTISTQYTNEGELAYDQEKVQVLKDQLKEALKNLKKNIGPFVFNTLNEDFIEITKNNVETTKNYLKLIPFLYNSEGFPLFKNLSAAEMSSISKKIDSSTSEEINEYYGNLIKHQIDNLKGLDDKKTQPLLNSFTKIFLSKNKNKILREAITPVGKDGEFLRTRTISLEEVPTLVALFRGEFAWDCATKDIPYYALVKGSKTYAIRKGSDLKEAPVGYLFMTLINYNGKKIPYIITISGEKLTNVDEKEAVFLIGKIWETTEVLFSNYGPTLFMVREGVFKNAKSVNLSMPSGWDIIDELTTSQIYSIQELRTAKLITLENTKKTITEQIPTPYKKSRKIKELPVKDRAAIAAYCLEDYKKDRTAIENIFQVSSQQLQIARAIIDASPENPINSDLFKKAKELLDVEFSDVLHLDIIVRAHSLSLLYKEAPEITAPQEWGKVFKNLKTRIDFELEKTEDTGRTTDLIKAKLSLPRKYWEADIAFELLSNIDTNIK